MGSPLLIAHGASLATVGAAANAAGVEATLLAHLSGNQELPFAGW